MASLQDLGRVGLSRWGVSPNGAADQYSARIANLLVGNDVSAPLIEITSSVFCAETDRTLLISLTGADVECYLDSSPLTPWAPVSVAAGSTIEITSFGNGQRAYLAIRGMLVDNFLMGSCAPDPLLGFGCWLRENSTVDIDNDFDLGSHPVFDLWLAAPTVHRLMLGRPRRIDVIPVPDLVSTFRPDSLYGRRFVVDARSDHVGLRLANGAVPLNLGGERKSAGAPVGALEVTNDGTVIVLLRGRQVTAGYPIPAVATRASQPLLGQAAAGDELAFRSVSADEALATLRRQERDVDDLRGQMSRIFTACHEASGIRAGEPRYDRARGCSPLPREIEGERM
jgi:biotin-dependent carboxylase-like uncharacterized protein